MPTSNILMILFASYTSIRLEGKTLSQDQCYKTKDMVNYLCSCPSFYRFQHVLTLLHFTLKITLTYYPHVTDEKKAQKNWDTCPRSRNLVLAEKATVWHYFCHNPQSMEWAWARLSPSTCLQRLLLTVKSLWVILPPTSTFPNPSFFICQGSDLMCCPVPQEPLTTWNYLN